MAKSAMSQSVHRRVYIYIYIYVSIHTQPLATTTEILPLLLLVVLVILQVHMHVLLLTYRDGGSASTQSHRKDDYMKTTSSREGQIRPLDVCDPNSAIDIQRMSLLPN